MHETPTEFQRFQEASLDFVHPVFAVFISL